MGLLLTVFVAGVALSAASGTPADLPAVALEWTPLFHLLRVVTVLAVLGSAALVGWRATEGHFPIRFGQIEYDVSTADDEATEAIVALTQRICSIESSLGIEEVSE